MFAIKLPTNTNIALNIAIPSNKGTSPFNPAAVVAVPNPG